MFSAQTKEILSKLNNKQMRKFRDFLSSPYFNTREALVKLFDEIYLMMPNLDGEQLGFEVMFKKLYPGKTYREQTIKNLYSEFGNLLKKFIGYEEFQTDEKNLDQYTASGLTKLSCIDISTKFIYKKLNSDKAGLRSRNNYYYLKNLYHILKTNISGQNKQLSDENHDARKNLYELLITVFLMELYDSGREDSLLLMHKNSEAFPLLKQTINSINIEKIVSSREAFESDFALITKVQYWLYYYTANEITHAQFKELKKAIIKIIPKFTSTEKLYYIVCLNQIIATKLIPKDKKYYKEVFALGKLIQTLKIFPDENLTMGTGVFRDFFTTAIILREFDWAENFINEYGKYLPEDQRNNEINLRKGILFFKKNKFELSLEYLNKMKVIEVIEKINVRFYYMMNYIELKAYESALSSLNSIRQFYNDRKEIPGMVGELILDSLKYFNEVIKCEEKGEKIEGTIYEEANSGKRYYHKQYILEKMEKLK
jgi:hypothetical protein